MLKLQIPYDFLEENNYIAESTYHVLKSLRIISKKRVSTDISLIIHPIVTLHLLKLNLLFSEKLKSRFYNIVLGIINKGKIVRLPSYANRMFLGVLCCLKNNEDDLLQYALKSRSFHTRRYREVFTEILIKFLMEVESEYQSYLSYSEKNMDTFKFADPKFLKDILYQASNCALDKIKFKFSNNFQLLNK